MHRARSYSFDDSKTPQTITEEEEAALEYELSSNIAARKTRDAKEGIVFLQEPSWLGVCCGLFSMAWTQRYAKLSSDKISFSESSNSSELSLYQLKGASVSISEIMGHDGRHNCISITSKGRNFFMSIEGSDELREWILSLNSVVEALDRQSNYFNFKM